MNQINRAYIEKGLEPFTQILNDCSNPEQLAEALNSIQFFAAVKSLESSHRSTVVAALSESLTRIIGSFIGIGEPISICLTVDADENPSRVSLEGFQLRPYGEWEWMYATQKTPDETSTLIRVPLEKAVEAFVAFALVNIFQGRPAVFTKRKLREP